MPACPHCFRDHESSTLVANKYEAGYLLHSGDPNMLWSPDHGILAYLTNDS